MKQLIERYVYAVTRRLPENQREEVAKELRANIDDMLPENPTEEEIEQLLISLGHPRKLANNYREKDRYLIGPEWMDDYLMVLRIVVIILASIGLVTGMIDAILNPEAVGVIGKIFEVFFRAIASAMEAAFSAFTIVTLVFIGVSNLVKHRGDKLDLKWLPELPKKKVKEISKSSAVANLIMNLILGSLFIYLFWTHTFNVVWIDSSATINDIYPIFNYDVTDGILPLFIVSFILTIGEAIYRLIIRRWTVEVYGFYTLAKIVSAVVSIVFLTSQNLLNPVLISDMAPYVDLSAQALSDIIHRFFIFLAVLTGVGAFADTLTTWFKKVQSK